MPRRPNNERVVGLLIDETLRGYLLAAKNRTFFLGMCDMAHRINDPEDKPKVPNLIRQASCLSRMCEGMSNELQKLHELQERIIAAKKQTLHIVFEHVDAPWRPEYAQKPNDQSTTNGTDHRTP
jgi:hypothetical protein